MINRILFTCISSLIVILLLLPIAERYTMAGHSLGFLIMFAPILGTLVGIFCADKCNQFVEHAMWIRIGAVIVLLGVLYTYVGICIRYDIYSSVWMFIPIIIPLLISTIMST